jgi:hypothetical protein
MSVYVDNMRAPYGRMIMCHMIADSRAELDAMAVSIGVARRWIQKPGEAEEHYDISLTARAAAVRRGAQEITQRQLAAKIIARRNAARNDADADYTARIARRHCCAEWQSGRDTCADCPTPPPAARAAQPEETSDAG